MKKHDMKYRIQKISHDFGVTDEMTYEEKTQKVRESLRDILECGYGGIVTNVCFRHYLESEEYWRLFHDTVEMAMELGLNVWIYDELGYPSGKANGKTLEGHPEYEAQGLVMRMEAPGKEKNRRIYLPYGHQRCVAALGWPGNGMEDYSAEKAINLKSFIREDGSLEPGQMEGNWCIAAFYTKAAFEGTHTQHNVAAVQRYINVLDKRAVRRFIELVYQPYTDIAGKWFGNGIEAVFTDEPSIMTPYLNSEFNPETILDPVDDGIPLYPMIPWVENIEEMYFEKTERELLYDLPYLFSAAGGGARERLAFYQFISGLYEETYFGQLADFCEEHGLKFSGHVLLEEYLRFHALFEGNILRLLGYMHIPGIDMLSSEPETLRESITTLKLGASVAHFHKRERVMCELSSYAKASCPIEFVKYALAFHMLWGVNQINSYYRDFYFDQGEWNRLNEYTAEMGEALEGMHVADVALYYPIETVWAYTTPSEKEVHPYDSVNLRSYEPELTGCEKVWEEVQQALLSEQIDYDILDADMLLQAETIDAALVPASGERHKAIVLPGVAFLSLALVKKIYDAAQKGVQIFCSDLFVPRANKAKDIEEFDFLWQKLSTQENVSFYGSTEELMSGLTEHIVRDVRTPDKDRHILVTHRVRENRDCWMLLNESEETRAVCLWLHTTRKLTVTDPWTEEEITCTQKQKEEYREICLEIPAWSPVLVKTVL